MDKTTHAGKRKARGAGGWQKPQGSLSGKPHLSGGHADKGRGLPGGGECRPHPPDTRTQDRSLLGSKAAQTPHGELSSKGLPAWSREARPKTLKCWHTPPHCTCLLGNASGKMLWGSQTQIQQRAHSVDPRPLLLKMDRLTPSSGGMLTIAR